ncbi:MAG: radical SAM protein [Magnetococcales bacterium]|nr:radical SAM protein [Magnetococcales bacterium]
MSHWRSKELTIYLNDSCNMGCVYCYPGDYKENVRVISKEFALAGIDYFIKNKKGPTQLDRVRFYALGEPTLEMGLIKDLYYYAKSVAEEDISFELQSNGTFTNDDAEWIGNHIDTVWISLDGPPEIHDAQRPLSSGGVSSDLILNNIKVISHGISSIGMRPTITNLSIDRMAEILEFASSINVDALYFHPEIKAQGKNVRSDGVYNIGLVEFAIRYIEDILPKLPIEGLFVGNFLTINFDEKTSIYCRSCLPCPQLTVDGYISACDKAPLGSDARFDSMIFGKWDAKNQLINLYQDKIDYLKSRKVENMEPCKECAISKNCGGGCLGEMNFYKGDIFVVNKEYCEAIKLLASNIPLNAGLYPHTHP